MSRPTNEELELYVMGVRDGDVAAIEAHLAADAEARAYVAEQAHLELALRELARAARFCPACDGVVRGSRCDECGAAITAGGFTVEEVRVQNAHGRLYIARDADGRRVALKELAFVQSPSHEALARFEREAMYLRALSHPAIPRFVASFQEGQGVHTRLYLAQEYIEGEPLDRRLADHWFDETEIVDIGRQVLDILVYLQKLSPMVVHRDIKPANLIRREDGSIALVDFGAAYDQGATLGSTVVGTFGYMPLEQMAGIVDATTDPYALGASLLHLLTRREPWKLLESPALGVANVSPGLRRVLHRLVAREPAERFPSAAEARMALAAAQVGEPSRPEPGPRRTRWELFALRGGVVLGAATVGAAVFGYVRGLSTEVSTEYATDEYQAEAAPLPAPDPLPAGNPVYLDAKDRDLHGVLTEMAERALIHVVIPADIQGKVTVKLHSAPWRDSFEMMLKSHGLWYRYDAFSRIARVAPQRQLDAEEMAALERRRFRAEHPELSDLIPLPRGGTVNIELQNTDLHQVLRLVADVGGVNIVVPDDIQGRVTVELRGVAWANALEAILEAHGLWYEFHGSVIRVAPRRQLDAEDMAEVERLQLRRGGD